MSFHDFPWDLYPDVLSRLPAKTLLKFRFVSKLWLSIIEDPKFSSMHANSLSNSSSITQICLLKSLGENNRVNNELCEISLSCGVVSKVFWPLPVEISNKCLTLVGSSNGVLCLVYEDETSKTSIVILWNPFSNKYQSLPPLDNYDHPLYNITYGFGYDNVNNDYKVLCFETSILDDTTSAKIYSRKSNTWRSTSLDMFPIFIWEKYSGVLFGGYLHWVSSDNSWLAFDISNEEFKLSSMGPYIDCEASYTNVADAFPYIQTLELLIV